VLFYFETTISLVVAQAQALGLFHIFGYHLDG